jgi:hypothetical protein
MVLEAFSVSHGKASAFLPVIDLLWSYFEISSADDERKRREKVGGKVLMLDRSLEDTLPYLYRVSAGPTSNRSIANSSSVWASAPRSMLYQYQPASICRSMVDPTMFR